MILPKAPPNYDAAEQQRARHIIEQEDKFTRKTTSDVEVGKQRLILTSPNGNRWNVTVSNAGALSATLL